jgi:hypothetical protein
MAMDGSLRFDRFDSSLIIEDGIEDKLTRNTSHAVALNGIGNTFEVETAVPNEKLSSKPEEHSDPLGGPANESRVIEIQALKKRVAELSKETAVLRHELSLAKSKLDQIKKIA